MIRYVVPILKEGMSYQEHIIYTKTQRQKWNDLEKRGGRGRVDKMNHLNTLHELPFTL